MEIQERFHGDTVVWAVHGQLTGLTRGSPFDEPLRRATSEHRRTIVLDLAGVSLVDAGGVGLLLTTYRAAIDNRIGLRLANVPPRVHRVLHLTKVTTVVPVVASAPADRTHRAHEDAAGLDCMAVGR